MGPDTLLFLTVESRAHFAAGRYHEAAEAARNGLNRQPGDLELRILLASSLGNDDRGEEARPLLLEGEPIDLTILNEPWAQPRFRWIDRERLVDGLRAAGWEG